MSKVPGYTVADTLWEDEDLVLLRGRRDSDAFPVLVETAVLKPPTPGSLERLDHEFALKDELDASWAIRPTDLSRTEGWTALVFPDPGGESLEKVLKKAPGLTESLRIAIGIASALEKLHKRNIIHKDIKPANILVDVATGHAWLMGFGIATRLPRELQEPEPPEMIAGTFAYMAPEQTGRMNRSIDSRSDLYSLGVTLYELFTGVLPFAAHAPMEWIHSHIARMPMPPMDRKRDIPSSLSQIVMKLMAKSAEDRYQTAKGAEADLRRCLEEWKASGVVAPFRLGLHDASGRMLVPEKLYGREREKRELLEAFGRVEATSLPEMMLVAGYSGIGKSSLVNELQMEVVPPRGLFAAGKFDQYQQHIPYHHFAQAFRTLVRKILSLKPDEVEAWRHGILEAVGANGRLVSDLIPELEYLIGKQEPVPDLSPLEAQNRFHAVFRRFLGAFARQDHPLVLFLDDIQRWDAASLKLLEHLSTHPDVRHLLLIGAFRDNEVSPDHPLWLSLEAIRKTGAIVNKITLSPLSLDDVHDLVTDTLHCDRMSGESLARLIHEKTAGNPFFAIQFLRLLNEEGLIDFEEGAEAWTWDVESIRAKNFTDNVADLMVEKLNRLPAPALEALKRMACLGSSADAATLARIRLGSEQEVHVDLLPAVFSGLALRVGDTYRFLHDKVKDAAYSLIPEASRAEEHLRIGRLLLAGMDGKSLEEGIFPIASQFNRGLERVVDPEEKATIRRLNHGAGRKAKSATAYESSRDFLAQAEALLPSDSWTSEYGETFALTLELAECEYLVGNFGRADVLTESALDHADCSLDRAKVHHLRIKPYLLAGRFQDSLKAGLEGLKLFGMAFPDSETELRAGFEAEAREATLNMRDRRIADLMEAPMAGDPEVRAIFALIAAVGPVAYATKSKVFPLLILKGLNLSLRFGNTEESPYVYAYYALLQAGPFDDIPAAYAYSELALRLNEKLGDRRAKSMLLLVHGFGISFWKKPFTDSVSLLEQAFLAGLDVGDFIYAGYAAILLPWYRFETGEPIDAVFKASEKHATFARQARHGTVFQVIRLEQQFLACLKGLTRGPDSFDDDSFNEAESLDFLARSGYSAGLAYHLNLKQIASFLYGLYNEALDYSLQTEANLVEVGGSSFVASQCFYHALTLAALYPGVTEDRQREFLKSLREKLGKLKHWAEHCPGNFQNRYALVSAELARIEGRDLEAMRFYEQAIRSARDNGFLHHESLAAELAGRFYSDHGFETIATAYLRIARSGYLRWGAFAKVKDLDRVHPDIGVPTALEGAGTIGTPLARLDFLAVVKSAQVISGEIVLSELVKQLLIIAIEHAGAEKGRLILAREGSYRIEAEAVTRSEGIDVRFLQAEVGPGDLPGSIFQFMLRTRERVLLDDASAPNPYSEDEYIRRQRPRSVLCLPLTKQAKLVGALYLENNLTPRAFTPERIAVLDVLAAQAAISLENARLYDGLQRAEERFSKAFRNSPTPMAIIRLKGDTYVDVNEKLLETFGFPKEDYIGHSPVELGIADQGQVDKAQSLILEQGFFHETEFPCKTRAGKPRVILASGEAIELEGEPCSLITFVDVTEHKNVESQLRQSQKMDAIGRLAGGVAHDFNNLLTAINGFSSLVLEGLAPSHPHYEYLREILKSGERAAVLTKQLLAHSRKQVLHPEVWNLNAIVEGIVPMLKRIIGEEIDLGTDLSPALGLVKVDRGQVEQILLNLVINARDAMPKGGKLTLETRNAEFDGAYLGSHLESAPGPHVMLAVSDTGTGMTGETKARLFEPFFTTKEAGKGTGLGLSVVYGIVKQSHGSISVYSELGMGSIFRIYFPETREGTQVVKDLLPAERPLSFRGNETVLLVEDAESVRKFATLALQAQGYTVLEAGNGLEALEMLWSGPSISLVITDVVMAGMGGVALAKRLRERDPSLPILFISGYVEHPDVYEGIIKEGEYILPKPFTALDLSRKVRELLDGAPKVQGIRKD